LNFHGSFAGSFHLHFLFFCRRGLFGANRLKLCFELLKNKLDLVDARNIRGKPHHRSSFLLGSLDVWAQPTRIGQERSLCDKILLYLRWHGTNLVFRFYKTIEGVELVVVLFKYYI
jgi:hypothetical protein